MRMRGLAAHVVPAAGFLIEDDTRFAGRDLARNLEGEGAADAGDGVEIFEFDLGAPLIGADGADGDVHVATHLAFFHVGVADAAVDHDLLEDGQVGKGFLGTGDLGFADDLHEGRAGAVEINAGGCFEVETFGHIFLEVDAGEADILVLGGDGFLGVRRIGQVVEGDGAAEAEGQIVLADLVVLRHVGVEIVFPVEFADGSDLAAQHEA